MVRMCGDRFSSSTTCSRWRHETEPGRLDQSLFCRFWKVATHPFCLVAVENGLDDTQLTRRHSYRRDDLLPVSDDTQQFNAALLPSAPESASLARTDR